MHVSISEMHVLADGCAKAGRCPTPLHGHACASSSASAAAGRLRGRPGGITQRLGGLAEEADQRKATCFRGAWGTDGIAQCVGHNSHEVAHVP